MIKVGINWILMEVICKWGYVCLCIRWNKVDLYCLWKIWVFIYNDNYICINFYMNIIEDNLEVIILWWVCV